MAPHPPYRVNSPPAHDHRGTADLNRLEPAAGALQADGHQTTARLEPDLVIGARRGEDECRTQHGVSRERQLMRQCEDPDVRMRVLLRRIGIDRFGEVDLAGQRLQPGLGDITGA